MLDLAIEFATLGEYGLEYPDPPRAATLQAPRAPRLASGAAAHRGLTDCRETYPRSIRSSRARPKRTARPKASGEIRSMRSLGQW